MLMLGRRASCASRLGWLSRGAGRGLLGMGGRGTSKGLDSWRAFSVPLDEAIDQERLCWLSRIAFSTACNIIRVTAGPCCQGLTNLSSERARHAFCVSAAGPADLSEKLTLLH